MVGIHYVRGVKGHWIPPAIDVIAVDKYNLTHPAAEAAGARAHYEQYIFRSLLPHQRCAIVPGLFGNPNSSHANTDDGLVDKLMGYVEWSQQEPRIVGMMPWHWDDLLEPSLRVAYR